eukprot:13372266-Alexandrium_andersonii.AAC.1
MVSLAVPGQAPPSPPPLPPIPRGLRPIRFGAPPGVLQEQATSAPTANVQPPVPPVQPRSPAVFRPSANTLAVPG